MSAATRGPATRRLTRGLSALALGALAACQWGPRPRNFAPARGPEGARVAVRVRGEQADRVGELYAVDAVGLTIADGRVRWIPWTSVRAMDVERMADTYDVAYDERVSLAKIERLALVSRFPQGLAGDLLASVLASHRQDAVERVP